MCIGCGMCVKSFDSMILDGKGFLTPNTDLVGETEIQEYCPGNLVDGSTKLRQFNFANDDVFGPVQVSPALVCDAISSRAFKASSGGGIKALVRYLLESKFVDCVVGVSGTKQNGFLGKSTVIYTANEIDNLSNSYYAPSSPLSCLRGIDPSLRTCVVGRPCDISAISAYRDIHRDEIAEVCFTISFFCGGTPSSLGTEALLSEALLPSEANQVENVKYRGEGCPGRFEAYDMEGKVIVSKSYQDAWGTTLNKFLHDRCKVCGDSLGLFADVSFGDYWDVDSEGYPVFSKDSNHSVMLVRTQEGLEVTESAISKNYLNRIRCVSFDQIKACQKSQVHKRTYNLSRRFAFIFLQRRVVRYKNIEFPKGSFKKNVGNFWGMLSRVLFSK